MKEGRWRVAYKLQQQPDKTNTTYKKIKSLKVCAPRVLATPVTRQGYMWRCRMRDNSQNARDGCNGSCCSVMRSILRDPVSLREDVCPRRKP